MQIEITLSTLAILTPAFFAVLGATAYVTRHAVKIEDTVDLKKRVTFLEGSNSALARQVAELWKALRMDSRESPALRNEIVTGAHQAFAAPVAIYEEPRFLREGMVSDRDPIMVQPAPIRTRPIHQVNRQHVVERLGPPVAIPREDSPPEGGWPQDEIPTRPEGHRPSRPRPPHGTR